VIICAYTEARWDDLVTAVAGVNNQLLPASELILVIDHNPTLLDRARDTFRTAKVMANVYRRGLSGARNTGIAAASGDIIAFMDEDAVPSADWLQKLAVHFEHADVAGAGGSIRPAWLSRRPRWFPAEFGWVVGCTYTGMPTQTAEVRNLIGCNMAFRRKVLEQAGPFTDGIGRIGSRPLGCEETELCIRIRQRIPRARFVYDPLAAVDHRVPGARTQFRYFLDRCYSEGLSKALVSQYVGHNDGLSSERAYTVRTLPLGVAKGLRDALRGDPGGMLRAGAIVLGFCTTVAGYLAGVITLSIGRKQQERELTSHS
jgi:glycosyltransferase involved in cell wall biosynthesis